LVKTQKVKATALDQPNHDELFKTLISEHFLSFLNLLFPKVASMLDPEKLTPLDKELFRGGKKKIADVVVKAKYQGKEAFFLILIEPQSTKQADFGKRMFHYFARLHERYDLPVYPIAVLSYDAPKNKEISVYKLIFPDGKKVLEFRYETVQLNQLNWEDYIGIANPVAGVLMAKMPFKKGDKRRVKLESYKTLFSLNLGDTELEFLLGFVDNYLRLDVEEDNEFQEELKQAVGSERVMKIMPDWKREGYMQGLEEGEQKGKLEGKLEVVFMLLNQRMGKLGSALENQIFKLNEPQIDALIASVMNLNNQADLINWLESKV
jgi:Domain of unknown function (DUF4351)/Putative transposase, YhgA-like